MRVFAGIAAITAMMAIVTSGAAAQQPPSPSYAADATCRQYADAAMAAARNEAPPEPSGSSLVGAGLGGGPPSAVDREAYARQRYNAAYGQCMAAGAAQPGAPPAYAPSFGAAPSATQLNRQELYGQPPPYPAYAAPRQ